MSNVSTLTYPDGRAMYPGGIPCADGYDGRKDPRLDMDGMYVGDHIVSGCDRCAGKEEAAITFTLDLEAWLCRKCVVELGQNLRAYDTERFNALHPES